jgi:NTP pyrophosphatase (non-canonical NTP hydrolase)
MNQEQEVMAILAEECAEVIQAISKCNRFGMDNFKPGKPKTNRQHLEEEVGDLVAMVDIMMDLGIISVAAVDFAAVAKVEKLKQWSTVFQALPEADATNIQ